MVGTKRQYSLESVLNEKQVHHVVKNTFGDGQFQLMGCDIRAAADGIAGFLGDHMKATLHLKVNEEPKKLHLFIKAVPMQNKPKAEFIEENCYFKREMLMYKVIEEIQDVNDPSPFCPKAYLATENIVVLPDLSVEGYSPRNFLETLDHKYVVLTITAMARFHAAFVNYETNKSIKLNRHYSFYDDHGHILQEPTFCDCPWLKACAKLTLSLLKNFSNKSYHNIPGLESKLANLYLKACDSLTHKNDTVNVIVHKDLWVNNIMFKYEDGVPTNTVLVDFQCVRYGHPAFDLMAFLYLTTSRTYREINEAKLFDHYYNTFFDHLSKDSKSRMKNLGYDKDQFLEMCEYSRPFGLFEAIGIFPYVLMDPLTAQKTFDDPETYDNYLNEDRTEPVVAHARKCSAYRERQLSVSEEFIERYALKN